MTTTILESKQKLASLVSRFDDSLAFYKEKNNAYNEQSCRIEYIDLLLDLLGWDVSNSKGAAPQFREVIAENYSTPTDRPDYSLTLCGVTKLFVEAKKPSVDILHDPVPALQARKYGWNAGHKITILTNFENLIIYDTTVVPKEDDGCPTAQYRVYNYTEYVQRFEEIASFISRKAVYSGDFDKHFDKEFPCADRHTQQVDEYFLSQINRWRVELSNELYTKGGRYNSLDVLNDVVQEFINQIVFLRICEDKNLPVYHNLKDLVQKEDELQFVMEELFRKADNRYNAGLFSGENIIFDLDSKAIKSMVEGLYYPQSPYLFNIIEPNMLGKIYEMFLTEQLTMLHDGTIGLSPKKSCINRSVVTTPTEIVKYIVNKTLGKLCSNKTPSEIKELRVADIACGSGIFLEETFSYLQQYCVGWYIENNPSHLEEVGMGRYKLPLIEKKEILTCCLYGIDIDIHAVEVAKFSLLIKLIEDETTPSVIESSPILPDISHNIFYGNSLIDNADLNSVAHNQEDILSVVPFDWSTMNVLSGFDAIIGNPPYVSTEDMHLLLNPIEFAIYKKKYKSSFKQFDKYFIFIERAISQVKEGGFVSYIVPNKFFKIGAGEKLRELIAKSQFLVSLDDFGDTQLFKDKTVYSAIILLQKKAQKEFVYSSVTSLVSLLTETGANSASLNANSLNKFPWRLTTDFNFLTILKNLDAVSVPITNHVNIFNGIQTSAERPNPVYWFSFDMVRKETDRFIEIEKDGQVFRIEKDILKPYFKPTKQAEKGLNSYSILNTDKQIIFPYSETGRLYPIKIMEKKYPGAYAYLKAHYSRLVPKSVSPNGVRDIPNATPDTWYQYGRTQALTAFNNTPKLIVGILSKEPMYAYDKDDMLIASGGTAGYCAISMKDDSPYCLEYIQAWLSNPYTEQLMGIVGSDFEGGFVSRGTFVLSTIPFVELNLLDKAQKSLYDRVVECSRNVYKLNNKLSANPAKNVTIILTRRKQELIKEIEGLIGMVYRLEF